MSAEATDLELAPVAPLGLWGTDQPRAMLHAAKEKADALAEVVKAQHLAVPIRGKSHVMLEGWTLLGSMLGVFPVPVSTTPIPADWIDRDMARPLGWECRAEARTLAGALVGAADGQCMGAEPTGKGGHWSDREDYALRSMAQTRAVVKALRLPLGFVMQLAGFDSTAAEDAAEDAQHQEAATTASKYTPHGFQGPGDGPEDKCRLCTWERRHPIHRVSGRPARATMSSAPVGYGEGPAGADTTSGEAEVTTGQAVARHTVDAMSMPAEAPASPDAYPASSEPVEPPHGSELDTPESSGEAGTIPHAFVGSNRDGGCLAPGCGYMREAHRRSA